MEIEEKVLNAEGQTGLMVAGNKLPLIFAKSELSNHFKNIMRKVKSTIAFRLSPS